MNERLEIAIYIRVSTEDQLKEGYSLEVQREYLESFSENLLSEELYKHKNEGL